MRMPGSLKSSSPPNAAKPSCRKPRSPFRSPPLLISKTAGCRACLISLTAASRLCASPPSSRAPRPSPSGFAASCRSMPTSPAAMPRWVSMSMVSSWAAVRDWAQRCSISNGSKCSRARRARCSAATRWVGPSISSPANQPASSAVAYWAASAVSTATALNSISICQNGMAFRSSWTALLPVAMARWTTRWKVRRISTDSNGVACAPRCCGGRRAISARSMPLILPMTRPRQIICNCCRAARTLCPIRHWCACRPAGRRRRWSACRRKTVWARPTGTC